MSGFAVAAIISLFRGWNKNSSKSAESMYLVMGFAIFLWHIIIGY